jgi:hypothetical protein
MQSPHSPDIGRHRHLENEHDAVFMLGEELKKPLTAIKALAEFGHENDQTRTIILESRKALRTIDNMMLYKRLDRDQTALDLVPVHIGSALTQVAHDLKPLALEHGCETEVFIQSGIESVSAHSGALRSSIECLWQAVISMTQQPSAMTWHISRSKAGVQMTLTNSSIDLSQVTLKKDNQTIGISSQPYKGISGSATDLVIAAKLLDILGGTLRKTKKHGVYGFTVTLPISEQLAFI